MSILIAITGWNPEPWIARFKAALPGEQVVVPGDPFDRRAVHYAMSWKHPPGSLAGLPNLAAIFSLGAGVDHLMRDPALPEVPILRVKDPDLTTRMSEYVVLHCLKILRQQMRYVAQQQAAAWIDDPFQPAACDVRVGIMGLGVLGSDAAHKLRVLGFEVAGWTRSGAPVSDFPVFGGQDGLAPFLARTDILVSLLPLTPETRGILARPVFEKLARNGRTGGPHLINAGRGGSQSEADILACLDDGTLASATLDVFEVEPLPTDSPLWRHPKVTITPHNSAISEPEAIVASVAAQVKAHQAGAPFVDPIDRARGY